VVALLDAEGSLDVVGQAESAEEALKAVAQLDPDVVLFDARLPGMSGIDAARRLLAEHPGLRVVLLTGFTSQGVLLDALDAGVHGLVLKESDATTIVAAVLAVASGRRFVDPRVEGRLLAAGEHRRRARHRYGLTPAELEVLEMVPKGLTNAEISSALGLSANTVKTHLARAMRKLQLRNRAEAAAFVLSGGLA
jgi:DNA-binding NarL/FixJ family response regulator